MLQNSLTVLMELPCSHGHGYDEVYLSEAWILRPPDYLHEGSYVAALKCSIHILVVVCYSACKQAVFH